MYELNIFCLWAAVEFCAAHLICVLETKAALQGQQRQNREKMYLVLSGSSSSESELKGKSDHSFVATSGNRTAVCSHTGDSV